MMLFRLCDSRATMLSKRGGQPAHRGETILHPHFAFEPANLSEIIESIDKSHIIAFGNGQSRDANAQSLAELRLALEANLPMLRFQAGQRIDKPLRDRGL